MDPCGRITVVGNPGLDTLVVLAEDDPDLEADGHFVRNVDTVGHAAAFTARACARLGHDTRILGSTGADVIGRLVRDVLAADGVDTSLMFDDPAGTARSVNFVRPDGRRTFFFDGGSHMTLRPPEPSVQAALSGAQLVLSSLPNWARDVVARARALGVPVAVDLQDVRDPADPYRADFIAAADVLFASAAHLDDPVAAATPGSLRGPRRSWCSAWERAGPWWCSAPTDTRSSPPSPRRRSTCPSSTPPAPGTASRPASSTGCCSQGCRSPGAAPGAGAGAHRGQRPGRGGPLRPGPAGRAGWGLTHGHRAMTPPVAADPATLASRR